MGQSLPAIRKAARRKGDSNPSIPPRLTYCHTVPSFGKDRGFLLVAHSILAAGNHHTTTCCKKYKVCGSLPRHKDFRAYMLGPCLDPMQASPSIPALNLSKIWMDERDRREYTSSECASLNLAKEKPGLWLKYQDYSSDKLL